VRFLKEQKLKHWFSKKTLVLAILLLGLAAFAYRDMGETAKQLPTAAALLVPDDIPLDSPYVKIWLDAASEVGVKVYPVHGSQWIQSFARHRKTWEGVILPDTFHRKMMPALMISLQQYVQSGGKLMVVYDAGTLDPRGNYPRGQIELAGLVGFDYALYNELREGMSKASIIVGSARVFEEIGLPPGRYVPRAISAQSGLRLFDGDRNAATMQVVGYGAASQRFPSLVTRGQPNGEVLLRNDSDSILASRHTTGKGSTLFVNLPLTYLKQRTDGIFLHGFLRYFFHADLRLPSLSDAPRGKGALVLNWHIDSKAAVPALQRLEEVGLFNNESPFSFHVTAGPDVNTPGDAGGLDLDNNPRIQKLLKTLVSRGHAVGSHGGWIHNYFGIQASEKNADEMEQFLEMNHRAITRVIGTAPREYSAPMGNQPLWAAKWLKDQGIVGTYLTGNIGMGPTRLWMGDRRIEDLWTFPVLTLGTVATAEDAFFQKVTQETFDNWLQEVARYVLQTGTIRLVYFHPPGAVLYIQGVSNFVDRVGACRRDEKCSWLTMTQAAEFMSRREQAEWSLSRTATAWRLKATHPGDLRDLAWRVPVARFAKPEIKRGQARIERIEEDWLVVVESGIELQLDLKEVK
jgi:Polysaccharide deacetylase